MQENAKTIWTILRKAGMSKVGAAAMLGNMQAESALKANNAQDGMTSLSDEEYTAFVDMGTYANFATDSVGYGLCQWTYPTRKADLLRFARAAGKSIGDLTMQVDFCIKELQQDFSGLWAYLKGTTDIEEAAGRICRDYERPAVDNSGLRALYAQKWYKQLKDTDCHVADAPRNDNEYWPPRTIDAGMSGPDVLLWQALMCCRGYECPVTGDFDEATRQATIKFQTEQKLTADGIPGPMSWGAGLTIEKGGT